MGSRRFGLLANISEERLLDILEDLGGYSVFTKVRLTDVIDDRDYPWNDAQREFMRKAHLDFVLTEPTGLRRVVAAIELDGPYHSGPNQRHRDDLKNQICREAGLPLFRFAHPGLDESTNMDWLAHVLECWKWDLRNQKEGSSERYPMCSFIAANKLCYLREEHGRHLAVRERKRGFYECPKCGTVVAHAAVTVATSDSTADGVGDILTTALPLSENMIMWLALDLAEYQALKKLGLAHRCGMVAIPGDGSPSKFIGDVADC